MVEDGRVDGYTSATYGDAFADVYDDWYGDLADRDATITTVAALTPAGGRVLELGVGTGRLASRWRPRCATRDATVIGHRHQRAMLERLGHRTTSTAWSTRVVATWSTACRTARSTSSSRRTTRCSTCSTRTTAGALPRRRRRHALVPAGVVLVEAFVPDDDAPAGDHVSVRSMRTDEVVLSVSRATRGSARRGAVHLDQRGAAACVCGRGPSAGRRRISSTTWPARAGLVPAGRWASFSGAAFTDAQYSTRQRVRHPGAARGDKRSGKKGSRLSPL